MKNMKRKITLETLAGMVAGGFAEQEKKITERITERITESEARISQQITGINNRINNDLALNRATRDEVLVLDKRVSRIETKLGLDFKQNSRA